MTFIGTFFMTASCVSGRNIQSLIFFLMFYHLLHRARELAHQELRSRKAKLCCQIPAALFACFMILGYSYYSCNSWELVFGSRLRFAKSVIAAVGYFLLFWSCIVCLFHYMDETDLCAERDRKFPGVVARYLAWLKKYPFRTVFLTLLIAYLPYMIYSWPGIFSTDTKIQLENGYRALSSEAVHLKNHHPVIHTLLLRFGAWIGETLFSSANAGISLISLAQALLLFASIAWMLKYLAERKVSEKVLCLILLFYIVSPRVRNYVFLLVKDTWFASFLLLYIVQLCRILTGRLEGKKHLGILLLSMLGVFFFRQDGVYVLALTWIVVFFARRKNRKLSGYLLVGILVFSNLFTQVLLPACQVTPTNIREMFSIPFQQTARYVRDAGEDVTEKEREAISAVLDYDHLAELYNPNLSDPVKATFNKEATGEELASYFQTWFCMLWKHPDIYVQATMNNLYGYFYPDGYTTRLYSYEESAERMEKANESLEEFGTDFGYPECFRALRNFLEEVREELFQLPVLSALNLSAFYIWLLILLGFYCVKSQKKIGWLVSWPLMVVLFICMAGPTYGWYFRYMYSIVICLPGAIGMSWSEK